MASKRSQRGSILLASALVATTVAACSSQRRRWEQEHHSSNELVAQLVVQRQLSSGGGKKGGTIYYTNGTRDVEHWDPQRVLHRSRHRRREPPVHPHAGAVRHGRRTGEQQAAPRPRDRPRHVVQRQQGLEVHAQDRHQVAGRLARHLRRRQVRRVAHLRAGRHHRRPELRAAVPEHPGHAEGQDLRDRLPRPVHEGRPGGVRQGRHLRRPDDHVQPEEVRAGLQLRHHAAGVRAVQAEPGQGREVQLRGLLRRPVHAAGHLETGARAARSSATRNYDAKTDDPTIRKALPDKFVFIEGLQTETVSTGCSPTRVRTSTWSPTAPPRRPTWPASRRRRPGSPTRCSPFNDYLTPNFTKLTNPLVRKALAVSTNRRRLDHRRGRLVRRRPGDRPGQPEPGCCGWLPEVRRRSARTAVTRLRRRSCCSRPA